MVVMLIFGVFSYFYGLKRSFFPELDPGIIVVTTVMPGASPTEIEEGITNKIEEALKGVEGVDEVSSNSVENLSTVRILLKKQYNPETVLADVKNAVDKINSFPLNAEKPIVFRQPQQSRGVEMALSGDVDRLTLKRFADQIEDELLSTGVLSSVAVAGLPPLEISVEVSAETLSRYGMTIRQIADAIRSNNRDISAGTLKTSGEEILIRAEAEEKLADRLGDIVVRTSPTGAQIKLRDIAVVREQLADEPNEVKVNGRQAVTFTVEKREGEDLNKVVAATLEYAEKFNQKYPNLRLDVLFNFKNLLDQRLNMLINNGIIGLFLVIVCLTVFLNLRVSVWVAAGIPIAFAGMLTVAMILGLTINMISLFGMILVVGILVDDGIVIAENIYTHYEMGKSPQQAAIDGTLEVAGSVFTSVMTTIVAFVPLLLLNSGGLEFMKEMAVVVVLSLSISLLEAFLILPAHMASHHVLNPQHRHSPNAIRDFFDRVFDRLRDRFYAPVLRHVLAYRYIYFFVPVAFIMVVLGAFKGELIKGVFFPQIPFDSFNVDIAFKAGTRESSVRAKLDEFEAAAWQLNEELKAEFGDTIGFVAFVTQNVGRTSDNAESGSHAGNLTILLKETDKKKINSDQIAQRLRKKLGEQPELEKYRVGGFNRFGKPISFSLFARDPEILEAAAMEMKTRLKEYSALRDITDNAKLGRREVMLTLKDKARILGFSHGEIASQVRQAFFGEEAQRIQAGNNELRVWVRLPETDKTTLENLDKLKIRRGTEEYPLSELADYTIKRGLVEIKHFQGQREIVIEAELTDINAPTPSIVANIEATIIKDLVAHYPGLSYTAGGQQKNMVKSVQAASMTVPLALLIIILLITLTFRSLSQALMIILMIPIGVYSAILGHGIEGKPFSVLSVWGTLALSGVIINDTVVFLDKFNSNLKAGMSFYDAVFDAGRSRFRAIILTSLTTVAGLYPLIMEKSFQAQFLIPMAISMAYGVLIGTFFTLLIFPTFIYAVNDLRRFLVWSWLSIKDFIFGKQQKQNSYPAREEVEPPVIEEKRLTVHP